MDTDRPEGRRLHACDPPIVTSALLEVEGPGRARDLGLHLQPVGRRRTGSDVVVLVVRVALGGVLYPLLEPIALVHADPIRVLPPLLGPRVLALVQDSLIATTAAAGAEAAEPAEATVGTRKLAKKANRSAATARMLNRWLLERRTLTLLFGDMMSPSGCDHSFYTS